MWDTFDPWLWSSQPHQLKINVRTSVLLSKFSQVVHQHSLSLLVFILRSHLKWTITFQHAKEIFLCILPYTLVFTSLSIPKSHVHRKKKIVQGYLPYASVAYQVSTFTYWALIKKLPIACSVLSKVRNVHFVFFIYTDGNKYPKRV